MGILCRVLAAGLLLGLSGAAWSDETITYSYDAKGRLVGVSRSGTVNNGVAANYCYDKSDNRAQVTVSNGACSSAGAGSNFLVDNASATEGGSITFTITRYGETASAQSVNFASAGDTAISGTDFTAASGTLSFAVGETSKSISVTSLQDFDYEGAEKLYLNLSGATGGATVGIGQGTGTIVDDEFSAPGFTISDTSVTEGGILQFVVTKVGSTQATISLNFATADGSAGAGSDYAPISGTITFLPSDLGKVITVATIDDSSVESTEMMTVNLSGATGGATISDGTASGTITDNDVPPPPAGIVIDDTWNTEGLSLTFTVSRGDTTAAVSVSYATAPGSAGSPSDFTAVSGTLSFAIGQGSKTITVVTKQNLVQEETEDFTVNLSNATGGATIDDAHGVGTIYDDDNPCPNCRIQSAPTQSAPDESPPPESPPGGAV